MNDRLEQAYTIARIALAAVLIWAIASVIHFWNLRSEDEVIADQINRHFQFNNTQVKRLEARVEALEKAQGH